MKIKLTTLIVACAFIYGVNIHANDNISGEELAKKYNLNPITKAERQWKKIFKKKRRLKLLGLNNITKENKEKLLKYLMNNSADADQATVPGQ